MARVAGFDSGFNPGFGSPKSKGYLQIVIPAFTGSYEDGDILSAVPWRRVRQARAEGLCFAKTLIDGNRAVDRLVNGVYQSGDIAEDFLAATSLFKFEFLGNKQGRITRLSDSDEINFTSNVPFTQHDGKTVRMDIEEFLIRRKATLAGPGGRGLPIFSNGSIEYWYGGISDYSNTALDSIWSSIESKTPFLESVECDKAHFSDYRKRLIISVDNFDDETASNLMAPKVEVEEVIVDSVSQEGNSFSVTLSAPPSSLALAPDARLINVDSEWIIKSVSGSTVIVEFGDTINTGPAEIHGRTSKRGNKIEWRNLRDVVESEVIDKSKEVRIDQIRKHVRSETVLSKV